MKHTKSYIKGHPNPQFTRKDFENLNGTWNFVFDDADIGLKNKYFKKFPANPLQINVPYTYETKRSGIEEHKVHNVVWYNRTINYTPSKKDTWIHFEGVDYYTRVYVNGEFVGEHKGGYTRFSFNITSYLKKGENSITLRVYDDLDAARIRGKQRWKPESFECFYVQTTGIWKTVWLEHKDPTHLDFVLMDPSYKYNTVAMEYRLAGCLDNVEIETIIKFGGEIKKSQGISEEDIIKMSKSAICKINMDTDLRLAHTAGVRQDLAENPGHFDQRDYNKAGKKNVKEQVAHAIELVEGV